MNLYLGIRCPFYAFFHIITQKSSIKKNFINRYITNIYLNSDYDYDYSDGEIYPDESESGKTLLFERLKQVVYKKRKSLSDDILFNNVKCLLSDKSIKLCINTNTDEIMEIDPITEEYKKLKEQKECEEIVLYVKKDTCEHLYLCICIPSKSINSHDGNYFSKYDYKKISRYEKILKNFTKEFLHIKSSKLLRPVVDLIQEYLWDFEIEMFR